VVRMPAAAGRGNDRTMTNVRGGAAARREVAWRALARAADVRRALGSSPAKAIPPAWGKVGWGASRSRSETLAVGALFRRAPRRPVVCPSTPAACPTTSRRRFSPPTDGAAAKHYLRVVEEGNEAATRFSIAA
jgi:hypothetical protein